MEKVEHLKRKFRPNDDFSRTSKRTSRTKKSRDRYKVRKFNRLLKLIGTDSVLNISSTTITPAQCAILSLGSGFIPTSMHTAKEEEILLLESLRVIDRIGNLDILLKKENDSRKDSSHGNDQSKDKTVSTPPPREDTSLYHNEFFENQQTFSRSRDIPSSLRIHQPQERSLSQPITKLFKKKFDEINSKLLNIVRSKHRRKKDNLPKKLRSALKELRELIKEKKIDVR